MLLKCSHSCNELKLIDLGFGLALIHLVPTERLQFKLKMSLHSNTGCCLTARFPYLLSPSSRLPAVPCPTRRHSILMTTSHPAMSSRNTWSQFSTSEVGRDGGWCHESSSFLPSSTRETRLVVFLENIRCTSTQIVWLGLCTISERNAF